MNNLPERNMYNHIDEEDDSINFKELLNKLAEKWLWFLISVIFCLLTSFLYLKYTAPTYQISARVLVNNDEKGGGVSKQAGALMDLGGLMGPKNSVDNEVEILKTRFLMEQVVRQMQLNIVYYHKINLVNRELYNPPFKLELINGIDTLQTTNIRLRANANGKVTVSTNDIKRDVSWGEKFVIKGIGTVKIDRGSYLPIDPIDYTIVISSIDEKVAALRSQLSIAVANKQVTIIDLGLKYPITKKGEDILNTLIAQYTRANLRDKNTIADSTSKFIKERLSLIATELGDVENKVESFKRNNNLADMSEQGKVLVQTTGQFSDELAKAETQVSILNDLEKYLRDEEKNRRVFPSSLLPQDMVFSSLMGQYNGLLIERDKLLLSVTEESPFIRNIDDQISGLRRGILANIESTKNTFLLTRNRLRSQLNQAQGQISGVPEVEKNYLKLARNRDIKQELYIFLMQKAEETAISKTSNISVAKVIDPPKAEFNPVSPKRNIVLLAGLLVGLVVPAALVILGNMLKTTVAMKEDITNATQVPVIGEISHNASDDNMIVANQSRSAISEQFRALRTNLSFYLKTSNENVILLTSSMSGEGKSFTAINLANVLALSGKRVLLMELDLRKPGLSSKLEIDNSIGFSNYTISPEIKMADIIKPLKVNDNMFIISSGPLPPNPAETLMSEHTEKLILDLKKEFDYIILDAPPIGIITDAQLLANYADVTLYLVRQNVTQKDQLKIVDELSRAKKMKNLGIVVNDIKTKSYGYGYNYGNYGDQKSKTFVQKIFNKLKKS
ncbi:polysaccharide biosynthesis tyrosine autokinase [Pedobacter agri]|uniref:GumC family protein n=1 Tax=Pedobacter agri TaxID=454586 RepID=UPI00292E30AC|nr:polysaccharide biosynthesis tyrosine autokinase [Pedobacter agri]